MILDRSQRRDAQVTTAGPGDGAATKTLPPDAGEVNGAGRVRERWMFDADTFPEPDGDGHRLLVDDFHTEYVHQSSQSRLVHRLAVFYAVALPWFIQLTLLYISNKRLTPDNLPARVLAFTFLRLFEVLPVAAAHRQRVNPLQVLPGLLLRSPYLHLRPLRRRLLCLRLLHPLFLLLRRQRPPQATRAHWALRLGGRLLLLSRVPRQDQRSLLFLAR